MTVRDDVDDLERISHGDEGAWARLYERHRTAVFRYAYSLSGDYSRAEDLAQEAFTALLKRRVRWRDRSSLRSYLLRSVHNRFVDEYRKRARQDDRAWGEGRETSAPERDALEVRERQHAVLLAVDALPEPQRDVVRLRVFGGLSYDEIAAHVGAPAATVRNRYRASVERLKVQLGERFADVD